MQSPPRIWTRRLWNRGASPRLLPERCKPSSPACLREDFRASSPGLPWRWSLSSSPRWRARCPGSRPQRSPRAPHRVDGVLADRGYRRDDHHPHNESGGDRVEGLYAREEGVPEERGDERQGEVPVDHRWHAGQDLERRLEPPPQTLRGVLAEVDSREQPYGKSYRYRDDGRHQRAVDERQDSEVALWRRPPRRSQKLHGGDLQEKPRGLLEEHDDDPERSEDRQVRAGRENELYDTLPGLPGPAIALPGVRLGPRPFRSNSQRKPSETSCSEKR